MIRLCIFLLILFQKQLQDYDAVCRSSKRFGMESFEEVPMFIALVTYMGWGIIILIGYVKEFLLSFIAKFVPSQNPESGRNVSNFIEIFSVSFF